MKIKIMDDDGELLAEAFVDDMYLTQAIGRITINGHVVTTMEADGRNCRTSEQGVRTLIAQMVDTGRSTVGYEKGPRLG